MAVALLLAAGSGERLGAGRPKAFVVLAGRLMVQWSVDALRAVEQVEQVVVALPPGESAPAGTIGVPGGATRSHSVRAALDAARDDQDMVVVHDAARPLATAALFESALAELEGGDCEAVVAAAPMSDTVKRADVDRNVTETLDRASLWAVQTPQVFRREALERALSAGDEVLAAATDDASLVEAAGGRVRVVPAPAENIKVTSPLDFEIAARVLSARAG
ncbi:MAG TPA: 2-C-methyl-D-erythritol 4-phosphate cytidylyltransferase [Solirubrobacteraceae bacterium]